MFAVSFAVLTNVVSRALPFQFTSDPDTNPVPFTVNVNPAPPGLTASGTSGWFMSGTGFAGVIAAPCSACAFASCAGLPATGSDSKTATAMSETKVGSFIACSVRRLNRQGVVNERFIR